MLFQGWALSILSCPQGRLSSWALSSLSCSQGRLPREQGEGQGGWGSPGGEAVGVGRPPPPLEPSIPLFGGMESMFAFPLGFPAAQDPFLPKNAPSATFTSPSALRGQRPRRAHGPSAAFQDGQPPALASPAAGQLPGAGVNTAGSPPPESLHGAEWVLTAQDPESLPVPLNPPRALKAHPTLWPLGKFPELFSASETLPCVFGAVDFRTCPALLGAAAVENC